jgi:hypothetical protein
MYLSQALVSEYDATDSRPARASQGVTVYVVGLIKSEAPKARLRLRLPRLRGDDLVPLQAGYFSTGDFGAKGAQPVIGAPDGDELYVAVLEPALEVFARPPAPPVVYAGS